jgi:lipopolysaccharide assembly outer membrane protein LptD (OstA)
MGTRNALFVLLVLFGLSGSVWAQTAQTPQLALSRLPILPEPFVGRVFKITFLTLNAKRVVFTYERAGGDARQFRFFGRVGFNLDGFRITADEADMDTRSGTINLRGNVSLKVK